MALSTLQKSALAGTLAIGTIFGTAAMSNASGEDATPRAVPAIQGSTTTVALADVANPYLSGKAVIFEYGPGITPFAVEVAAKVVQEDGNCPVTISDKGRPKAVRVKIDDRTVSFSHPTSAAGWALDHCQS